MLDTDKRTPGLYYWCPIFGNGNGIDTVQPPQLVRLLPGGTHAENAEKCGIPQFDAQFLVCDVLWKRFAGCPQNARVYGYRILNEKSQQYHDALQGSNH